MFYIKRCYPLIILVLIVVATLFLIVAGIIAIRRGASRDIFMDEVARHADVSDCWTVVDGRVYDATTLIERHSGGPGKITSYCGRDGSVPFHTKDSGSVPIPHSPVAKIILEAFYVGDAVAISDE